MSNYLKLPPISSMDPSGSWPDSLPTPPQQDQQWKSPPYHHSLELNRDISFGCHQQNTTTTTTTTNTTLPIMQPLNQKIEQDINTVHIID